MAVAVGAIGHEDRLSVVDHLEELRWRLIVSLAVIGVAFGFCMWQNHELLTIINRPLAHETQKQVKAGNGPLGATYTVQEVAALDRPGSGASPQTKAALVGVAPALATAINRLSAGPKGDKPVTLGIGEPFATTLGVALMFALILALPVLLYEIYGFLLPAFSPAQRRIATPLMLAIPVLFIIGVLFGYFIVLPAAVRFFQNFNRVQRPGAGESVLPFRRRDPAGNGPCVPGASGDPRSDSRGDRDDQTAPS